jgi:hypothetical protein
VPKRSRKKNPDINEIAAQIVQQVTGPPVSASPQITSQRAKNPAAVELGRLGGLKGGKARAKKLSAAKRAKIARKAAKTRWSKAH